MDAHVYWDDRLVGRLSGIGIDQPYYHGVWTPTGDQEFERAFRAMQRRISPDGLGMLPVTLCDPDGNLPPAPACAMVRPPPESVPYFRFGHPGQIARVVRQPSGQADDLRSWHEAREAAE